VGPVGGGVWHGGRGGGLARWGGVFGTGVAGGGFGTVGEGVGGGGFGRVWRGPTQLRAYVTCDLQSQEWQ
jgi:hypothetical protein